MKKLFLFFLMMIAVCNINAQIADVKTIIAETCKQAAQQNKKAFIIFHASWCVWCKKLDNSMNDATCKEFFDDNFVINHVTVAEVQDKKALNNPGADTFLKQHHADDQGIPAWFILDKDENVLADSQLRPKGASFDVEGSNVGCPSNETEINYFINILEKTSVINKQQEEAIKKRFALNAETAH